MHTSDRNPLHHPVHVIFDFFMNYERNIAMEIHLLHV